MDHARSGLRLVAQEAELEDWEEAQRAIRLAKGWDEAIIERQLQELDECVVGTSAVELAELRNDFKA